MAAVPRILIAVDFSGPSTEAFEAGKALAKDVGADLVLVHTFPKRLMPTGGGGAGGRAIDRVEGELDQDEAMRLSEDWAGKARDEGFEVITVADEGRPVDVIVDAAKKHQVSTIVVGTHGRSGLARIFLGSVAEGVLRAADRPVLVVPWSGREHSDEEE